MTSDLRLTLALWRSSRRRDAGERAYLAYALALSALVLLAPLARVLALAVVDPAVIVALAPSAGSAGALLVTASCWLVALAAGAVRGPVVMAPFLADALVRSALPRRAVYRGPLVRAMVLAALAGAAVAAVPALTWTAAGAADAGGPFLFVIAGAAAGVATALFWLLGQWVPAPVRGVIALAILAAAVVSIAAPSTLALTPLGWIALAYGSAGLSPFTPMFVLVVLLGGLAALAGVGSLGARTVVTQSRGWDAAVSRAGMLELASAAEGYRPVPARGRGHRAVRGGPLPVRLLLRDAIAAARTPWRLVAGSVALLAAGAAVGLGVGVAAPWLGAGAAIVAYLGAGPLTDGIRHTIEAASAIAVYGASDQVLLAAHGVFPLIVVTLLVGGGALAAAVATATTLGAALVAAVLVALGTVVARVSSALKPPMPLALLAPLPTPAGDLSVIGRIVWATDAVLLTGDLGAVVVIAPWPGMSWPAAAVLAAMGAVAARRWRRR